MTRWKSRTLLKLTYCFIFSIIFCDWYVFPFLFSNVVHSRYFSCKDKNNPTCNELNELFVTRKINCDKKANKYWINQPKMLDNRISNYPEYNKHPNLDLLVMIISVRRRQESYLQHITKVLHQQTNRINNRNKDNKKGVVDLLICNADAELDKHQEAIYLSQFVAVISINRTRRSHKCCTKENW